ncbi:MAG: hypothetical protein CMI27_04780 [Opitutae bacterium]|nr:hypothetical protein [Opitutae bacterium]
MKHPVLCIPLLLLLPFLVFSKKEIDFIPDPFDPTESDTFNLLVWGGGYSPSGNQLSLESNIQYFRKIRPILGLENSSMWTLFADGKDLARDLQFNDSNQPIPLINEILSELLGTSEDIGNRYRNNRLNPDDNSSNASLSNWLGKSTNQIGPRTNLIYFTGHGGKGTKKHPENTHACLWNNQIIKVSELTSKLDELPEDQACIMVMVQCYSGGFANFIFNDGNFSKGPSGHARAGFFATTFDRVAAGCTPDIQEGDYKEYSTHFWEALCGKSRTGKSILRPDYNGNGRTSLSEAHAYVVIHSDTIDLPIKTSEVFLRNLYPTSRKVEKENRNKSLESMEYGRLLEVGSSENRAVFIQLSNQIGIEEEFPYTQTKKKISGWKSQREKVVKEKKIHSDRLKKSKDLLKKRIKKAYPELQNPYHPLVLSILNGEEKESLISLVNQESEWRNYISTKKKVSLSEARRFALEKKEVKAMRLLNCMETIFLEDQLFRGKGVDSTEENIDSVETEKRNEDNIELLPAYYRVLGLENSYLPGS